MQERVHLDSLSSDANRNYARKLAIVGATLSLLAIFAFAVDMPVARFCVSGDLPGDLQKLLMLAEAFAHGIAVGVILLAVVVLDPDSRRKLPRLASCAYVPGIINTLFKLSIGRQRPNSFGAEHLPQHAIDTFVGLFPSAAASNWELLSDRSIQSFASGHTTAAVGLAIGLTWLYPRGRWLFATLACLGAMQRLAVGAYYLSDTLVAAALTCFVCMILLDDAHLGRFFEKIEQPAKECQTRTFFPRQETRKRQPADRAVPSIVPENRIPKK